jgi:Ankyrin repeat
MKPEFHDDHAKVLRRMRRRVVGHSTISMIERYGESFVNYVVGTRQTLLECALIRHNDTMVDVLLQHGARIDIIRNGKTMLHRMANAPWCHAHGIIWLLDRGADPNAGVVGKMTPFMRCVRRGNVQVIAAFISACVDLHATDDHGHTCAHYARTHAVVKQLHVAGVVFDGSVITKSFASTYDRIHAHELAYSHLCAGVDPTMDFGSDSLNIWIMSTVDIRGGIDALRAEQQRWESERIRRPGSHTKAAR